MSFRFFRDNIHVRCVTRLNSACINKWNRTDHKEWSTHAAQSDRSVQGLSKMGMIGRICSAIRSRACWPLYLT